MITLLLFLFFLSLSLTHSFYYTYFKIADKVTKSKEGTDDIFIELKVMNERCILLTDEIQQLKREVSELSKVT